MEQYDVIIVGAGAVGSAIAYRLSRYRLNVAVLEKEADAGMGTSGRNSGVVHAGFNNRPGSLMAKLCVKGNEGFEELCRLLDVPYRKTGKLLVGFDEEDKRALLNLIKQGEANGCKGLRLIEGNEKLKAYDPALTATVAMLSPNTAVFNPFLYTIHLAEAAAENGVRFFLNSPVEKINAEENGYRITAGGREFSCRTLVNGAGLFADRISEMAGDGRFKIYPCRGQYYLLDKGDLKLPVYPVPRAGVGGLGVHLTVSTDGNIMIGPSADYLEEKEDYGTTEEVLAKLTKDVHQLLPSVNLRTVIRTFSGIRPKLVPKGKANFGDFVIERSPYAPHLIQLVGIESPGITASMPIAELVEEILKEDTVLEEKTGFRPEYRGIPRFAEKTEEEKAALIAEDPDYGDVVCRCETVTRAEVKQALRNPLGARSIAAVKNRVRVTMGRCNGGYCFQRVVESMLEEGTRPEDIILKRKGDAPLSGWLK